MEFNIESPRKRRRLNLQDANDNNESEDERKKQARDSLSRPVSPPKFPKQVPTKEPIKTPPRTMKSPFQLTWVRDLPVSSNTDTVTINDILGDPLIAECWEFNYLHDLDFLMGAFDPDVKDLVKVHVIHGFWKREDTSRLRLVEQAAQYPNLTLHAAYMPEMFGTHHTKMLILLRHDCTAQIIVHTANMIPFDWTNMTQGLWRSPLLPLLTSSPSPQVPTIGSGAKFKLDLLAYLAAYGAVPSRSKPAICSSLMTSLETYDFSLIRASFISSAPGRHSPYSTSPFGWPSLLAALKTIPSETSTPTIILQVSSIATLGPTPKYLNDTIFSTLATSASPGKQTPKYHIVFPTPDEVRRSLNGYMSGNAIHIRLQSAQQTKQLQYLKPHFTHWASDSVAPSTFPSSLELHTAIVRKPPIRSANRNRAAPHIKTYIRFSSASCSTIDWAFLTSANLSKQAWGEARNSAEEVRISSYEAGVLVWPGLWGEDVKMVPTFGLDEPSEVEGKEENEEGEGKCRVGIRMPYDIPLTPYEVGEEPWCPTRSYAETDWRGEAYLIAE